MQYESFIRTEACHISLVAEFKHVLKYADIGFKNVH